MSGSIIAGVDGSPESLAAAEWAAREAERRGAPLLLANAWAPQSTEAPLAEDGAARQEWAARMVRDVSGDLTARHPELTVATRLVPEPPVAGLLSLSEDAETLALGSRGRGAVLGFLLGSVGLQVLARSRTPVVMVRSGAAARDEQRGAAADDEPVREREVVVGLQDLDEASAPVLDYAFTAAESRGLPLRAVRAWTLPPFLAYGYGAETLQREDIDGGLDERERNLVAEALAPWRERYPTVTVIQQVEIGGATQLLLSASARAVLLVVGRRSHRPPIGSWVGAVAHGALHHADCPVAVVPHE